MTSARTIVSTLPRGFELEAAQFSLTPDRVNAYLGAVGDRNAYGDVMPPLAVVALALAELQKQVALPEGSLHTAQEVEHIVAVRTGEVLTMRGRIAQRSERQGFVISVIELDVLGGNEELALRARTTVMAPGARA
jgi:hypothetical protein